MSIFNNTELLNKLLKIAQQPAIQSNINTQEIDPNTQEIDPKTQIDLAKQLIQNLRSQISGEGTITADRPDAAIRPTHLQNLDNLLHFISFNGIKYNNLPIIYNYSLQMGSDVGLYNKAEFDALDDQLKSEYMPYPIETPQYQINKVGLLAWLQDLLKLNNPLLNAMIKARIDDINLKFNLNFPKEYQTKKEPKVEVAGGGDVPEAHPEPINQSKSQVATISLLNKLFDNLPFDRVDIDFGRIDRFIKAYQQLIQGSLPQDRIIPLLQYMQTITNAMQQVQNSTRNNQRNFPMSNFTMPTVKGWVKPQGQWAVNLLDNLGLVIQDTELLLHDLTTSYSRYLNDNQKNQLFQQSSIYKYQFNDIQSLKSEIH